MIPGEAIYQVERNMYSNIPKPPTSKMLKFLEQYRIDIEEGKVYNNRGGPDVGFVHSRGYVKIKVAGRTTNRSHIIWWKATGEWPIQELDHKDRIKSHDWYSNLEPKTHAQNMTNITRADDLPLGVSIHKATGRFAAYIYVSGKKRRLGYFATSDLAKLARESAVIASTPRGII